MSFWKRMRVWWLRIYLWEFWPVWFFYIPIYVYHIYSSLRARNMIWFSAANPGMEMGGFVDASKYDILLQIDKAIRPAMCLIRKSTTPTEAAQEVDRAGLRYPLVAKPNIGERGYGVAKLDNEQALSRYVSKYSADLLLQEYADLPEEYGVMYYRLPGEKHGVISSIVKKVYLKVSGDGASTLKELLVTSRAMFYYDEMAALYKDRLHEVLPSGEELILVPFGNHVRGATFMDATDLITPELARVFDNIADQVEGYHFGRFDIRMSSAEDLYHPERFKIIELNGANSEPAHIYEPGYSIWKAYRVLFRQWSVMFRISRMNHSRGVPYMGTIAGWKQFIRHFGSRKQFEERA